jgi:dTMP kinase
MVNEIEVLENFIVLEGLDGSGTTTQLNLLGEELKRRGRRVFTTCEPSPLPTGQLIRRILGKEILTEPETLARLFSADRFEHLNNKEDGILKHLSEGSIVISDRYLFSSLAYQSLECGFELVNSLNQFPLPSLLVYIELTPEICRQRMTDRVQEELFETGSIQMQIVNNYDRAIKLYENSNMEILKINGAGKPSEICAEIMDVISR